MNTHIITEKDFRHFKRQAKKLAKEQRLKHTEALDIVAKKNHFHHWKHVVENKKRVEASEIAFKSGLIIALDIKDSENVEDGIYFVRDKFVPYFCECDLYKEYIKGSTEIDREQSLIDCRDYILNDLVFLRYLSETPSSINKALSIIQQWIFPSVCYVWLNAQFYDADKLGEVQEKKYTLESFFNKDIVIGSGFDNKEQFNRTFHLKFVEGARIALVKYDGSGNAETLTPRQDLYPYSGSYSWGYKGSGVLNLAYAVLGNCLVSDTNTIEKNVVRFVEEFLSELDGDSEHIFSEAEIVSFLN